VGARPPEKVGLPPRFWLVGVLSFAVFSLLLLIALPWWVAVLGGVALGAFFSFRVSMISVVSEWFARRRKGSAAAFAMYKSMGITGAHPVRVQVILGGYIIGRDEGLVVFNGPAMEFFGSKTRFKIDNSHGLGTLLLGFELPQIEDMQHVLRVQPFERLDPNDDTFREHLYWRDHKEWEKAERVTDVEEVHPPKTAISRRDVELVPAHSVFLDARIPIWLLGNLAGDVNRGFTWVIAACWLATIVGLWIWGRKRHQRFLTKVL
jgi:hypothetical protein